MSIVRCKFVLTGPLKGKTIKLRNYSFVGGELSITGTPQDIAMHAQFLERNWGVRQDRDDDPEVVEQDAEDVEEPAAPEPNDRLRAVVLGLDPNVDDNWTANGRPAIVAVQNKYGSADVTRALVEAAAPGFNRDAARELRESKKEV